MLWLWILGAVAALVCLALFLPVSISLILDEQGTLKLRGRIAGITVYRDPKPERPVKLSDYSPRALRKRQKAALRRAKKAQKKEARQGSSTERSSDKGSLLQQITSVKETVGLILRRSLGHARIRVERLAITVATDDAAKTALLYGAASAAFAALTEVLDTASHLTVRDRTQYGVAADFTGGKCRADIKLLFRLRVCHLIDIAVRAILRAAAKH